VRRILFVIGTRPEAIKMAPVIRCALGHRDLQVSVCSTGQHKEMLQPVLSFFDIPVHFELDVIQHLPDLNGLFARIIQTFADVLSAFGPDRVLVHGDTTSAAACALASFNRRVPVGHVEAGLRTRDLSKPFPEEFNRQMIDLIADHFYAPTEATRRNLLEERKPAQRVYVTGNTVVDALLMACAILDRNPGLISRLESKFAYLDPSMPLVLVTAHRRESFGQGFKNICSALRDLARTGFMEIIYPVHLNPNVREPVMRALSDLRSVHLIDPVSYPEFIYLMRRATIILTDSGGIQEEAPSLGKPVLVMRDVTERPEAVEIGIVRLVGTDPLRIVSAVESYLNSRRANVAQELDVNPYGDGHASERIVQILEQERPDSPTEAPSLDGLFVDHSIAPSRRTVDENSELSQSAA
jgi:UDP-N-acetylglucosamine 2-epimerase (non-hydrolysing)